ncbi:MULTISPECIES: glutathione S-transferase [Novosphingobium]|jgi:glutathione S-transferase|uniref:glutathione S-transferase n=1 Tax=Novosphingobium TaxID=165696 RepID=UPI0022F28880|nr:glutathione S-transferase [Novosphingobium resinovorum]GLK44931.1 glutathione S-transferase [Novosphingobium resinovorum]
MADFDLYYWPVPFRGQFLRGILAYAGANWAEHGSDEIGEIMGRHPSGQPIPFMGPPVLVDNANGFSIAQMPAIAWYLGEKLDLLPQSLEARAQTMKVVNDANDVLDEITLDGGREMWTGEKWRGFMPRLRRWMEIWEATGRAGGLVSDGGTLFGTRDPGLADIVTATLWSTISERFAVIATVLAETAPQVDALVRRMQATPGLALLAQVSRTRYGDAYCGGEIEKSLRAVAS